MQDTDKTKAQLIDELIELRKRVSASDQERVEHLNRVLRAIRDVNQLIVCEKNRDILIQRACEILIETRGYQHAWIVLTDDSGVGSRTAEAGLGERFAPIKEQMVAGDFPVCCRQALESGDVVVVDDPASSCGDCPLTVTHGGGTSGVTVRLEHEGRFFGALGLAVRPGHGKDPEEISLVTELAGDLGLALHSMQIEEDQRRTVRELREGEERYRRIAENAPDMIYRMSIPDGRYEYVSPVASQIFGYTPEEFYNTPLVIRKAIHPDWQEYFQTEWKNLLDGEMPPTYEYQIIDKAGTVKWLNQRNMLVRDQQHRPIAIEGIVTDVSDRVRAEIALRDEKERIRTILDLVGDPIFVKDDDHRVTLANRAFYEMFAADEESVLGKTLVEAVPENERNHFLKVDRDVLDTGVPDLREEELTVKDITQTIITRKSRFIDQSGKKFLVGSIHDITDRKRAEDALRKYRTELEHRVQERTTELTAANRELEAFAYSVSHDLRAPLRGIDGFSKALLDDYGDKLDATAKDYLNRVRAGTQRMGTLIDDLLELSRLTRSEMRHQRMDLGELAKKIAAELQRDKGERRVDFEVSSGLTAHGDRALLGAALENLLRNAWKFTGHREHATIEFGVTEHAGERVFFIRDNGAGFDMAYVDKLFGPFQRLHDTAEFPGSGIGLAIVQRVILRHGGRIWADGEVDKGATFYFTLPTKTANAGEGADS